MSHFKWCSFETHTYMQVTADSRGMAEENRMMLKTEIARPMSQPLSQPLAQVRIPRRGQALRKQQKSKFRRWRSRPLTLCLHLPLLSHLNPSTMWWTYWSKAAHCRKFRRGQHLPCTWCVFSSVWSQKVGLWCRMMWTPWMSRWWV